MPQIAAGSEIDIWHGPEAAAHSSKRYRSFHVIAQVVDLERIPCATNDRSGVLG